MYLSLDLVFWMAFWAQKTFNRYLSQSLHRLSSLATYIRNKIADPYDCWFPNTNNPNHCERSQMTMTYTHPDNYRTCTIRRCNKITHPTLATLDVIRTVSAYSSLRIRIRFQEPDKLLTSTSCTGGFEKTTNFLTDRDLDYRFKFST